jgi:hypothetical protein
MAGNDADAVMLPALVVVMVMGMIGMAVIV